MQLSTPRASGITPRLPQSWSELFQEHFESAGRTVEEFCFAKVTLRLLRRSYPSNFRFLANFFSTRTISPRTESRPNRRRYADARSCPPETGPRRRCPILHAGSIPRIQRGFHPHPGIRSARSFRPGRRHPAMAQILQYAGFVESLVGKAGRGIPFGELPVVENTCCFQAREHAPSTSSGRSARRISFSRISR